MIKHSVRAYSTGREHRLVYVPDTPVTGPVQCRVYCPGDSRCTETHDLAPVDAVYEFYYKFRHLGDYLLMLNVDGTVTQCLKAVVEK
jgi:hypothetical protein